MSQPRRKSSLVHAYQLVYNSNWAEPQLGGDQFLSHGDRAANLYQTFLGTRTQLSWAKPRGATSHVSEVASMVVLVTRYDYEGSRQVVTDKRRRWRS